MTFAEKSGAANGSYNSRHEAGLSALLHLGLQSFQRPGRADPQTLQEEERNAFLHAVYESRRVTRALEALRSNDSETFGALLNASRARLRDRLKVSCSPPDSIVDIAVGAGAEGARLTHGRIATEDYLQWSPLWQ